MVVSYCMVRKVVTYVLARALSISPGKARYTAEEGTVAQVLISEKSKQLGFCRTERDCQQAQPPTQLVALIPMSCLLAELAVKDAGCFI